MSFQEFEQQIKDSDHKGIIILQLAMTMGAVMFPTVLVVVGSMSGNTELPADADFINILSIVTAAITFANLSLFMILPKVRNKKENLDNIFSNDEPVNAFLSHFRSMRILQLAILEAAALLGGVCCFLALSEGVLPEQSVYWANLIPCFIFLFTSIATFPSKNHLYQQFRYLQELNSIS